MGHHRTSGAFGKRHEWRPYKFYGRLPQAAPVTLGDLAGAFAILHRIEYQQKIAERDKELSFKLGRKVEELTNLRKKNEQLVADLKKVEGDSCVIKSDTGRSILAQIINNNKKAADLKAVIADLRKQLQ